MQNLEWHLYDKSNWPDGEWKSEPDKIQWLDKATGYPCLVLRHSTSGVFCGYVGVNKVHPMYEVDFKWARNESLEVHGDINYTDKCSGNICHVVEEGEDDDIWWLGFDCGHIWDIQPIDLAESLGWVCPPELKQVEERMPFKQKYRNVAYVKEQCANLARQLKELEINKSSNST